jgi:thioredoxin reductase (NADPH)
MHPLLEYILRHLPMLAGIGAVVTVIITIRNRSAHQSNAKALLDQAVRTTNNEPLSLHPEIDPNLCSGCGACTLACPEGDILKMINHKAQLVSPTQCVGHGECERACPMSAITLVFGTKTRGAEIPRLTGNYETNVPGMYIAGELGGMGLIRNAVKQGAMAAEHAIANLGTEKAQYDLFIVGAGAAGMAAGLSAIAGKRSYMLVEQEKFGGTIANFPRQKLVMSHPLELPIVGKRKFESNTIPKEGLLEYWHQIRKQTGLKVNEGTRFETMEKRDGVFHIKTSKGTVTARKIILAMGVRGTARKLGIEGEGLTKVTYNLLEPEQYKRRRVVVVGGGNAAAEAALMLSEARYGNQVHMIVRTPSLDRCNDENRRKLTEQEKKGRVQIWYNAHLVRIEEKKVTFERGGKAGELDNDYVFIFAGAEMPRAFLMSLGVAIDKKFGEGLRA